MPDKVPAIIEALLAIEHVNESKSLDISSTPTFVINGERVLGALPYQHFQDVIEKKLAATKK